MLRPVRLLAFLFLSSQINVVEARVAGTERQDTARLVETAAQRIVVDVLPATGGISEGRPPVTVETTAKALLVQISDSAAWAVATSGAERKSLSPIVTSKGVMLYPESGQGAPHRLRLVAPPAAPPPPPPGAKAALFAVARQSALAVHSAASDVADRVSAAATTASNGASVRVVALTTGQADDELAMEVSLVSFTLALCAACFCCRRRAPGPLDKGTTRSWAAAAVAPVLPRRCQQHQWQPVAAYDDDMYDYDELEPPLPVQWQGAMHGRRLQGNTAQSFSLAGGPASSEQQPSSSWQTQHQHQTYAQHRSQTQQTKQPSFSQYSVGNQSFF